MHTVTLKADDRLYGQIALMAEELDLSKSELIRRALIAYQETLNKSKVKRDLQEASFRVRNINKPVIDLLDGLASDGLTDA